MGIYQIHGNWHQMSEHLKFISNLIELDLKYGPFITGSYMTWQLEKRIDNPEWTPEDLDICCTSEGQFQQVKQILEPLATDIKETNWLGHSGTYWTIDGFKYQAFVHPVTVEERLNIVDYTITAIACDGKKYITGKDTLDDIVKKIIRLNDNVYRWPVESIMGRYKKYLNRGYKDVNNDTLMRLNKIYET